jgi:type IV secretion system T-DNA border endonuclease VirD2
MARAATGARPAVFKAIRNGGTHNRTELARQLTYVATKSCYVFDAHGDYDGQSVLTPSQIVEATERFAQTWDKARPTKLGHTSHLLLSFPLGTKAETVLDVTRGVVEQFFQGQGAHFDYIVAVHDDRDHKHAHVILNRHSPDGEMFYLRSGHHHSYELFREAMVEHGDRHGLRLEATRRLDRGLVTYDARSVEVQQARVVGVERIERERVGPDLERARRHIALASSTYRGLAGAANHEGFHQVSEALLRASLTLANNGIVLPTREIEMADTQGSFDGLVREFGRNVQALEERIASAPPAQRPRLERGLTEALSSVASLNPLGEHSALLKQAPSTFGVYSQARIERDELGRLDDPRVSTAVDAALQGTGLTASEVLARVRVGADSAALEDHWHHSDVQAVGARLGLDAAWPEAKERVLDRLEDTYSRIETTLQEVGVLRDARVEGDERERAEEVTARGVAVTHPAQRADERAATLAAEAGGGLDGRNAGSREVVRDPLVEATAARVRDQAPAEYAFTGDDAAQAQPFRAALERQLGPDELARLRQGDESALSRIASGRTDRQALAKAYLESDPTLRDTPAHTRVLDEIADDQVDALRARHARQEAEEHAAAQSAPRPDDRTSPDADKGDPLIAATATRLRDQAAAEYAFRDVAQAKAFKDMLERELAPEELARLREGDESALSRFSDDRLGRLALAKAYLESDPTTRDTAAHHRVLDGIVDSQFDERRLVHGHEEDGHTHG